jgi:uncharacterized protein DUF4255
MSNFLAIATVTAALSQALQTTVGADVPGTSVTTARPDSAGNGASAAKVNIYLYQITTNTAWRNADLPTRRADGQTAQRPQAALDLHYLLTFYGDEVQFEPQRLLGSAVRTLHARPVLTRQMIRDAVLSFSILGDSDLADAAELVKFTPIPLTLEELSKLWSVFFQTPYALSVAYQGTVVLIESQDTAQTALPVRQRNLSGVTFRQPVVEQVNSRAQANQPIVAGDTLAIVGKRLRGDLTQVRVSEIEVAPAPQDIGEEQISLPLPAGLQAGVHGLQVIQPMLLGMPPVAHRGVESNVAPFVLHPTIAKTNGNHDISVSNLQVTGDDTRSADISVKLDPEVGKRQRVVLLLNEFNPPADRPARAYSFIAPSRNQPGAPDTVETVTVPVSGMKAGGYLMRVQVDGAESALDVDTDTTSPSFNQYSKPSVSIA